MSHNTIAICLYSKYSQRCKEFLDEMGDDIDVQLIPIDHRQIRDTLMRDSQGYHVKSVPCIFLMFPNGRLEKYEGSDAFVWLRKVREVMEGESVEPFQPPPPPTPPTPPRLPEEDAKMKVEKMIETEKDMNERGSDQFITKKQDNIKEIAQAMQRQRESEEENTPNPPLTQSLPIDRP